VEDLQRIAAASVGVRDVQRLDEDVEVVGYFTKEYRRGLIGFVALRTTRPSYRDRRRG
jgi:hypothetical protein